MGRTEVTAEVLYPKKNNVRMQRNDKALEIAVAKNPLPGLCILPLNGYSSVMR